MISFPMLRLWASPIRNSWWTSNQSIYLYKCTRFPECKTFLHWLRHTQHWKHCMWVMVVVVVEARVDFWQSIGEFITDHDLFLWLSTSAGSCTMSRESNLNKWGKCEPAHNQSLHHHSLLIWNRLATGLMNGTHLSTITNLTVSSCCSRGSNTPI